MSARRDALNSTMPAALRSWWAQPDGDGRGTAWTEVAGALCLDTSTGPDTGPLSAGPSLAAVALLATVDPPMPARPHGGGLADWVRDYLVRHDPLAASLSRYHSLCDTPGWDAAGARCAAAEELLVQLFERTRLRIDPDADVDLLLRGSAAQAMPTVHSDLDFEVSGECAPDGHQPIEAAMATVLCLTGIDAEASAGRPTQTDFAVPSGRTRDLHEWSELRRAGDHRSDRGWVGREFAEQTRRWWARRSQYEAIGRQRTPKYAFFEARALIARVAGRERLAAGTTAGQLAELSERGPRGAATAAALRRVAGQALALYEEAPTRPSVELDELQWRLNRMRRRLGLPGPDLSREPGAEIRRSTGQAHLVQPSATSNPESTPWTTARSPS